MLLAVFRPKAIWECGDMSPLLNETISRRVPQGRPAQYFQQLRDSRCRAWRTPASQVAQISKSAVSWVSQPAGHATACHRANVNNHPFALAWNSVRVSSPAPACGRLGRVSPPVAERPSNGTPVKSSWHWTGCQQPYENRPRSLRRHTFVRAIASWSASSPLALWPNHRSIFQLS